MTLEFIWNLGEQVRQNSKINFIVCSTKPPCCIEHLDKSLFLHSLSQVSKANDEISIAVSIIRVEKLSYPADEVTIIISSRYVNSLTLMSVRIALQVLIT